MRIAIRRKSANATRLSVRRSPTSRSNQATPGRRFELDGEACRCKFSASFVLRSPSPTSVRYRHPTHGKRLRRGIGTSDNPRNGLQSRVDLCARCRVSAIDTISRATPKQPAASRRSSHAPHCDLPPPSIIWPWEQMEDNIHSSAAARGQRAPGRSPARSGRAA